MPTPTKITTAYLSTDHLSPETCKLLDQWAGTVDLTRRHLSEAPIMIGATETGWFMTAHKGRPVGAPDDLWACMQFAHKHDCTAILFDADGDVEDDLPSLGGPAPLEPE